MAWLNKVLLQERHLVQLELLMETLDLLVYEWEISILYKAKEEVNMDQAGGTGTCIVVSRKKVCNTLPVIIAVFFLE